MAYVHLTGYDESVESNVDSFIANLPEMLGAMAVDPRCLVAVIEFADARYVQFWVEADGRVISEVISNLNMGDAVTLSESDEAALRAQGWNEPSPGPNPNWRFESGDVAGLISCIAMTRHAVYEVLGERPENPVSLRTWSMPRPKNVTSDQLREEARVHFHQLLAELERELDQD